jgi:hypothetical protein
MRQMRWAIAIASLAVWCTAATYRTANFVVHAPTSEIAQRVGQLAEHYRREKALQWLGYELPTWNVPVPIRVVVLPSGPGGATSYQPVDGQIFDMQMTVQGPLERIYNSVLPHEITHTVLVSHFRCPLPRWADEGSAVLSEDEPERRRHDQMVRQALAQGRAFPPAGTVQPSRLPGQRDGHPHAVCPGLFGGAFSGGKRWSAGISDLSGGRNAARLGCRRAKGLRIQQHRRTRRPLAVLDAGTICCATPGTGGATILPAADANRSRIGSGNFCRSPQLLAAGVRIHSSRQHRCQRPVSKSFRSIPQGKPRT